MTKPKKRHRKRVSVELSPKEVKVLQTIEREERHSEYEARLSLAETIRRIIRRRGTETEG